MKDFAGKIAVITGGGTGMGRELAKALAAEGCSVAICDISEANMAETARLCQEAAPQGTKVSTFRADVAIEQEMNAWAEAVRRDFDTDKIHLLFNNAGIGGGGSFVAGDRKAWERTFAICFYGVINGVRAFLPLLQNASEGHIVNTSSVNGFWASLGPGRPHTAYSAAKFGVKGFTEALIEDLRLHAPHISCSVVMPGHIGTDIAGNSMAIQGGVSNELLLGLEAMGVDTKALTDEQMIAMANAGFRDNAPTSAAKAAQIILDGVRANRWRILVGEDAIFLDQCVRADPEAAYTPEFLDRLHAAGHLVQAASRQ
ncbi:NAD(P)-dependent dehydrogenase (short-subunit alcohol dehydrogenase family) [Novosphingobium kunmingense]|uniref:NAD(P)-dependent dehydrogenase (Short-subunit alcohol dehydrogenase family) n=1 Tax=Novosphingobium kunmingense TaxID=1211806 RepID=A0A2N0HKX5_9SPHN|nr:SDR family NAD(P)-dependent oxidoreductase [Novosphingobium kunmingense]PKB19590.1 NAD(P)-dependent dehydrogenase (short-subunit alcohol dehydrogenase family) [Novosphingobium kunmingense]